MRRDRFSVSCFISEVSCWLILETVGGVDTSSILSASSASCGRDKVDEDEARTILTEDGRRCRNSYLTNALSGGGPESPKSCCIRRRS